MPGTNIANKFKQFTVYVSLNVNFWVILILQFNEKQILLQYYSNSILLNFVCKKNSHSNDCKRTLYDMLHNLKIKDV